MFSRNLNLVDFFEHAPVANARMISVFVIVGSSMRHKVAARGPQAKLSFA